MEDPNVKEERTSLTYTYRKDITQTNNLGPHKNL
jgi:hypothetical protein